MKFDQFLEKVIFLFPKNPLNKEHKPRMESIIEHDAIGKSEQLAASEKLSKYDIGLLLLHDKREMLQMLVQKNIPLLEDSITFAAWYDHLELAKWLRSLGYKPTYGTLALTAARDYWEFAEWALEQGISRCDDCWCMGYSASMGNLGAMKKLFDWGFTMNEKVADAAAKAGHLDILKWLRSKGCPFNPTITIVADPSVTKWLMDLSRD